MSVLTSLFSGPPAPPPPPAAPPAPPQLANAAVQMAGQQALLEGAAGQGKGADNTIFTSPLGAPQPNVTGGAETLGG